MAVRAAGAGAEGLQPGESGVGSEEQGVHPAREDHVGLAGEDLVLGQADGVAAGRARGRHQDARPAHAQPPGDHVLGAVHGLVAPRRVGSRLALAENDPEPVGIEFVAGQPRLLDRLACRDEGKLGGAVQGGVGVRQLPGDPLVGNLARVPCLEHREGLVLDRSEATLAGREPLPELRGIAADGTDDSQAGDDDGAQRHACLLIRRSARIR